MRHFFASGEIGWLKSQLGRIEKQPEHVCFCFGSQPKLEEIVNLLSYVSFSKTRFVTFYDPAGKERDRYRNITNSFILPGYVASLVP